MTRKSTVFTAIMLMAGCTTDATDHGDGAEITSQDARGVTGTITRDGATLRFETQTGTGNGTVGAIARILDEHDRMIAAGFFGHDMPPAWIAALPDVAPDDPARLALADASADLATLDLPEAHGHALALLAQSVQAIPELEARIDTDPDANIATMDALDPDLQAAIGDYYATLASEAQIRRAFTLGKTTDVVEQPVAFAGACNGYDVYKQKNTLLGFTAYRFHQWRNWCWDTSTHRMAGEGDHGSYPSNVNSAFKYLGSWVYQDYWRSYPYQHVYSSQAGFENHVPKLGSIGTSYPWIQSTVDGWGSWTTSKGF